MAFDNKNLTVLAYANGFTMWHYAASEPMDEIDNKNYFGDACRAGRPVHHHGQPRQNAPTTDCGTRQETHHFGQIVGLKIKGDKMEPKKINGQWRLVYDGRFDWVNRAGLAGKLATDIVFDSWDDVMSYLDKCGE